MWSVSECKYYASCGLCTLYDKECHKVCKKPKRKSENKEIDDIRAGNGLRYLDDTRIDENHIPTGISIEHRVQEGS